MSFEVRARMKKESFSDMELSLIRGSVKKTLRDAIASKTPNAQQIILIAKSVLNKIER